MDRSHHVLVLLPVDDTASIMKEPNSGLSGTLQEPRIHASPLHCPVRASSVPGGKNKNIRGATISQLLD